MPEESLTSIAFIATLLKTVFPVKIYPNFYHDRKVIRNDHKSVKSGIYLFVNLLNPLKIYVGQSSNILGRINNYMNNSYLKSKKNSNIPFSKALLAHGQENFCLIIVEYVPKVELNTREMFWISLLKPYYNIGLGGSSSIGFSHTEKTKNHLRILALNKTHTSKTKVLISEATRGTNNPFYGSTHSENTKMLMSQNKSYGLVYIYDYEWQLLLVVSSVKILGNIVKSNSSTIVSAIMSCSLFRGNWYFTSNLVSSTDVPQINSQNSEEAKELCNNICLAQSIRKAVFLFNASTKEFVRQYDGVIECARDLKISHNTISKQIVVNGKVNKSYIVSGHRLKDFLLFKRNRCSSS